MTHAQCDNIRSDWKQYQMNHPPPIMQSPFGQTAAEAVGAAAAVIAGECCSAVAAGAGRQFAVTVPRQRPKIEDSEFAPV